MSQTTPERILEVANELFSKFGFEGTSIRDIAAEAEVNVAAINYHFKNKQILYWEIYLLARTHLEQGIKEMVERTDSTEALVCEIFDFMLEHGSLVRNTFKLILSESAPPPPDPKYLACMDEKSIGPPGGEYLLQTMSKELPDSVSPEAKRWAVKGLFTFTSHWALMSGTSYVKNIAKASPDFSPEKIKEGLRHQVRAILHYLKTIPQGEFSLS